MRATVIGQQEWGITVTTKGRKHRRVVLTQPSAVNNAPVDVVELAVPEAAVLKVLLSSRAYGQYVGGHEFREVLPGVALGPVVIWGESLDALIDALSKAVEE